MTGYALWLAVFGLAATLDVVWARYIQAAAKGHRLAAATWSLWIYLLAGAITLEYVKDNRLLLIAAVGSFVGTFFGTKRVT